MSEMLLWLDVTSGYSWGVEMNIDRYRDAWVWKRAIYHLARQKWAGRAQSTKKLVIVLIVAHYKEAFV